MPEHALVESDRIVLPVCWAIANGQLPHSIATRAARRSMRNSSAEHRYVHSSSMTPPFGLTNLFKERARLFVERFLKIFRLLA